MKSYFYYIILLYIFNVYSQEEAIIKIDNYAKFNSVLNAYISAPKDNRPEIAQSLFTASSVLTQDDIYSPEEGHFGLYKLLKARQKTRIPDDVVTHVMHLTPSDTFLDEKLKVFNNDKTVCEELLNDSIPLSVIESFAKHLLKSDSFAHVQTGRHFTFLGDLMSSFYNYPKGRLSKKIIKKVLSPASRGFLKKTLHDHDTLLTERLPKKIIEKRLLQAKSAFLKIILQDATLKSGDSGDHLISLLLYNNLYSVPHRGRSLIAQELVRVLEKQDKEVPSFLKDLADFQHPIRKQNLNDTQLATVTRYLENTRFFIQKSRSPLFSRHPLVTLLLLDSYPTTYKTVLLKSEMSKFVEDPLVRHAWFNTLASQGGKGKTVSCENYQASLQYLEGNNSSHEVLDPYYWAEFLVIYMRNRLKSDLIFEEKFKTLLDKCNRDGRSTALLWYLNKFHFSNRRRTSEMPHHTHVMSQFKLADEKEIAQPTGDCPEFWNATVKNICNSLVDSKYLEISIKYDYSLLFLNAANDYFHPYTPIVYETMTRRCSQEFQKQYSNTFNYIKKFVEDPEKWKQGQEERRKDEKLRRSPNGVDLLLPSVRGKGPFIFVP